MSDYWFPSVDGSGRVAAGAGRVVLRQPDGTGQIWWDVHRPFFRHPGSNTLIANGTGSRPAGVYMCFPEGDVRPLETPTGLVWGANDLSVGDGWAASANAGQRAIMVWPSGAIIDDAASPSIWGPSLVCIKYPWDSRRHLALNPPARGEADRPYLRLAEGDVRTPRLVEDMIAWCIGTTPWFRWPDGRVAPVGLGRDEFWPLPVRVDGVIYLMTHDDRGRLMLREPGQHMGRVIHHGVTDYPAIAATGDEDEIHVAWSDRGELGEWRGLVRDLPLVDLRFGPPAEPPVLPLDIWEWMSPSQDGLIVATAGGQTLQTWKVGDDTLDQVKWGNPKALERWSRHADEIRLDYDATDPKGVESPWRLVPNQWARRQAEPGVLDVYPYAVLIRRQRGTTTREPFPFAVGQGDFIPAVDLGGDLGYCAVRTLTFSPWYPSSGETEINWYAIRLSDGVRFGRVRFQLVKAGRTIADALLNRVLPGPGVRPAAPLPIPDPPQELTVGRADYPREITSAGFDVLVEDGAGRFRAEWSVRDGQRSVFALTLDGQRATRTVAHPTVIGVAPPGTPPAAGGPAYGPWVLERPSEYTRLREAVEAKWSLSDQATRDEKLAHAIKRRFEGHALAKILDEIAREGEASPPDVEPPPVDPPPAGGLLHASNFLSEPGHAFFLRFAAFADIVAALQALEARGYRDAHMLAVEADPYSDFDLYADIPRARRLITAMLEFHLRPWIWLLPETPAVIARYTQDQWIGRMEGLVAGVDDLPVRYCAALESPEYWTDAQLERWVRAIRRVTQRPIAVHGTPGHVFARAVYAAGAGYHFHQFVSESRGGGFLATEAQVRAETQAHAHRLDGWGVRFVAFEYAHRQSHADAARLGDLAVTLGSYGFGNGGTTPPEDRYVAPRPPEGGLDAFDLGRVQSWLRGPDVAAWPVTSVLAQATCDGRDWRVPHSAAGSWPTFDLGPDTPVEGNVWIVAHVGGRWCAAPFDWMRVGQTSKVEPIENLGVDQVRQAPMDASWVPRKGDELYLFVSTPARDGQKTSRAERSNVMRLTWL